MVETGTRYPLNQKQLHILRLLFKFRFITVPLLATYKSRTANSIRKTLNLLVEENYIAKKHDSTYILLHRPAVYYLTAKGMAVLRLDPRINPVTLNTFYNNKSRTDTYMLHVVDTMEVYTILHPLYGDDFEMFSKQEVARFDDFPASKPDLYLRGDAEYFIILVHDLPLYLVRKQLREYITHFDEEGWTHGDYPGLLFVFADSSSERRFLTYANATLEGAGIDSDELLIGTTTLQALRAVPAKKAIWSFADDVDTRHQLTI